MQGRKTQGPAPRSGPCDSNAQTSETLISFHIPFHWVVGHWTESLRVWNWKFHSFQWKLFPLPERSGRAPPPSHRPHLWASGLCWLAKDRCGKIYMESLECSTNTGASWQTWRKLFHSLIHSSPKWPLENTIPWNINWSFEEKANTAK